MICPAPHAKQRRAGATFGRGGVEKGMSVRDAFTILLVDDDPGDVAMISEALQDLPGQRDIHVVGDGVEALEFLRHNGPHEQAPRPDMVVLDLNMPRMDGRQVLAEVKTDAVLRAIPVVVFTTSASQDDINASYDRHANAYVTKPVDLDNLGR